jgi:transcriptional regulator with XRE-family HTH domain
MTDCWPKRVWFKKLLSDYRERNKVNNAEIAESLGISPESLKKYISPSPTHRPGEAVLRKAGEILGVDWREFLDEGSVTPEPRDEPFGNIMGILGKNLTEAQKAAMIEMAKAGQIVGRAREAAEKKGKG